MKWFASVLIALCALSGTIYGPDGSPALNSRVTFQVVNTQTIPLVGWIRPSTKTVLTNSSGVMPTVNVPQGITIQVAIDNGSPSPPVTIPNSASADISTVLPSQW